MNSWYSVSMLMGGPCSPEPLPHLGKPRHQGVDLVGGGVDVERRTRRRGHPEAVAHRTRAVVADAYGNAEGVEHLADVVGVHGPALGVEDERHRPPAVHGRL